MMEKDFLSPTEQEACHTWDAVIPLPTYPFPQRTLTGQEKKSGWIEQIAGLPNHQHYSGLWVDTRLKDLATALMVRKAETATVLTVSRSIRPWMQKPYTELMENDVKQWLGVVGIPGQVVEFIQEEVTETEGSYDLYSEMEVVRKLSLNHGWKSIALISDEEHGKRAQKVIDTWTKTGQIFPIMTVIPMEMILTDPNYVPDKYRKRLRDLTEKLHSSLFWKYWIFRELVARNTMGVMNWLAQKTR